MSKGTARQQYAVLEKQPAAHRIAGIDVFRYRMVHKADRSDDLDLTTSNVGFVHHPSHTAEVIGMGVGVDHRHHRALTEFLVDEVERRFGGLFRGQRIEDDPAGLAFDKADVGQIESTHLIDPGDHFVQAVVHVQDGLPLQRWMDTVKILALQQPLVAAHIPGDMTCFGLDLLVIRSCNKSLFLFLEIPFIIKRQGLPLLILQVYGKFGRHLPLGVEMLTFHCARIGHGTSTTCGKNHRPEPDKNRNSHRHCECFYNNHFFLLLFF